MSVLGARFVEAREEQRSGGVPAFRVVLDVARDESDGERARREVVVEIPDDLAVSFATRHPEWRPARSWAAFFAASRHEVLEGLLETTDVSVELAEPPRLEECRPPPDWTPESWPPETLRVEAGEGVPDAGPVWRRRLGRLMPRLSDAQETRVPLVMIGVSLAVLALAATVGAGDDGIGAALLYQAISVAVSVATGIAACWLAARFARTGFGYLRTALVKLAAVFTVPTAADELVAVLLGMDVLGLLFALTAYCWLLAWFFDLDIVEMGVIVVLLVILRLVVMAVIVFAVLA